MKPLRILVVEDEAVVAMDIEERLTRMGYEPVGRASRGLQAIDLARKLRPDVVLMDIRIQGDVDGIAAAREIHQVRAAPVVFLTAYADDETLQRAKHAEPYSYVIKPFKDAELRSAIEVAHHKHASDREIDRLNRLLDVHGHLNESILRCQSREELFASVCRVAVERGAVEFAWIGMLDAPSGRLAPVASFSLAPAGANSGGCDGIQCRRGRNRSAEVVREGQGSHCCDCGRSAGANIPGECCLGGYRSCGTFPIRFQGEVCGAFMLCVSEGGFFQEREVRLMEEMAQDISFVMDKLEADARKRQAEERLAEKHRLLQTILDTAPQLLVLKDRNGVYQEVNPAFCRFLGRDRGEIVGRQDVDLLPSSQAMASMAADDEAMRTGSQGDGTWAMTRDGVKRILHVTRTPIMGASGDCTGVLCSMVDLTEQKALEARLQQAQKMESVGRLAGAVAHDFNNMLGVIIGYLDVVIGTLPPSSPAFASLEHARRASNRSADLTRQLLAFARKQAITPEVLDLNESVVGMFDMLQRLIGENIRLAWEPGAAIWPVRVDPSQVDQILANLCANARCAIADVGEVVIATRNRTVLDGEATTAIDGATPGDYVCLSVRDDGCGIDSETLPHIFEPFFTTRGVGTGLGLATVYGIVQQNQGFIVVDSAPGRGATFSIHLPRHAGKIPIPVSEEEGRPAPTGGETILLVEDEPSLLELTAMMLESQGYRVLPAEGPIDALEVARTHDGEIHLLMTDVVMPEMNGWELARQLMELHPRLKRLFVSGYTADVVAQHGVIDAGIHFLQKPFNMKILVARIREVLAVETPPAP